MKETRVRYAPSPTGDPHVGNIRSAIFNWLFARNQKGKFILRIEDTDQARMVDDGIQKQKDALNWMGLNWDEVYIQSERIEIYTKYAKKLIDENKAYRCFATQQELDDLRNKQKADGKITRYDGRYRNYDLDISQKRSKEDPFVIRFKSPQEGITKCYDEIRGEITFNNKELDDFIIMKSDGFPTYHFANVVDDHLMNISHVMRAEEWLPSLPKHVNIYKSLDWEMPLFVHLPMILASDKTKLSKRHGATSIQEFINEGYIKPAMFNFLVLLGWALDDKTEQFTIEELINVFNIKKISKSPAIFNKQKLDWFNGKYIRELKSDEIATELDLFFKNSMNIKNYNIIKKYNFVDIANMIKERSKTLKDSLMLSEFIYNIPSFKSKEEVYAMCDDINQCKYILKSAIDCLNKIDNFSIATVQYELKNLMEELNLKPKNLLGTLRIVITNQKISPPVFDCISILGKKESVNRISSALDFI